MKKADWQQDLFDLMANERIRLSIEGETGDMDGTIAVFRDGKWREHWAVVISADNLDDLMCSLMAQMKKGK